MALRCPFCGAPEKDPGSREDVIFVVQIDAEIYHCRCYDCGEEWIE